jgi:hypothetical protein
MLELVASMADRLVSVKGLTVWDRGVTARRLHIEPTLFACERHGDADCRPEEDTLGSTPNGTAFNTDGTRPRVMR